jgi:hypothetical protein
MRVLADGTLAKFCRREIAELGMAELPGPEPSALVRLAGQGLGAREDEHAADDTGREQEHAGQNGERLLERK